MQEVIKIRCPFCSAVMAVKNKPGLEKLNVPCPVCKRSTPFVQYKVMGDNPFSGKRNTEETIGPDYDERTRIPEMKVAIMGVLRQTAPERRVFKLKVGRNIIGRAVAQSTADICINTGDSRRMSREHLMIEVKSVPGHGYVYYARLCKEKVNRTLINNKPLDYGECVVLENRAVITLPDATVCFEIPDPESTELN